MLTLLVNKSLTVAGQEWGDTHGEEEQEERQEEEQEGQEGQEVEVVSTPDGSGSAMGRCRPRLVTVRS
jgi:hypothetical protein